MKERVSSFLSSSDLSSSDNNCKQFGSGSKLFDTLIAFEKEFSEKVNQQTEAKA